MAKAKTDTELLAEISLKLDSILSLLAARAVQEDDGEVVVRLNDHGHAADVIGRIVGISENAVNIRLSRHRKKSGKSQGKSAKKAKVVANDKPRTEEGAAS